MKKTYLNLFCKTSTVLFLLLQFLLYAQSAKAQLNTATFNLQKASDLYDERGFMKGKSLSVDGNLVLNNSNGNVSYIYPVSSFNVQGYPMNVSLNYCGSVAFTSFQSYTKYGTSGCDEGWSKTSQNKPLWIIGLNGFAVQTISQNTEPVCSPQSVDHYVHHTTTNFDPPVWLIDGYDFCNRMTDFEITDATKRVDVIKLLRSDGSILELVGYSDNVVHHYSDSSFYSGMYFEKGTNTKGYAIVEFKESRPYYFMGSVQDELESLGHDTTNACQIPRIVHYFPGDGLEYVFREDVVPYGSQFYLGEGGSHWMGGIFAGPTIFYLDKIQSQKRTLMEFRYEDDYYIHPADVTYHKNYIIGKGRKQLRSFFGHTFLAGGYIGRIESFGKTTEFRLNSELRAPMYDYNMGSLLTNYWPSERSSLPMVEKIIDPAGRQVSFEYGSRTRTYTNYGWPYYFGASCSPITDSYTPAINVTAQRMIKYKEPLSYTEITYHLNDTTTVQYGTSNAQKIFYLSDVAKAVVKKRFDNNQPLLTRKFQYYGDDPTFDYTAMTGSWEAVDSLVDYVTGKVTCNVQTFSRQASTSAGLIADNIPCTGYTDLQKTVEYAGAFKTKTLTTYDWIHKSSGDTLNIRLPIAREVWEYAGSDSARRTYSTFEYVLDTVVHFNRVLSKRHYSMGVVREYENVWRPDTTSTLLYRKITDYQVFPDSLKTITYAGNFNKIVCYGRYLERKRTDPSFTKTWAECVEYMDTSIIKAIGGVDSTIRDYPDANIVKATYITDGDSINYPATKGKILQGTAKKFASISKTAAFGPLDRVMVVADTIFGLGGNYYVSSKYSYGDTVHMQEVQGVNSMQNANGAVSEFRYRHIDIPDSWNCTLNSHNMGIGKIHRNDNTDTIGECHNTEQDFYWHEPNAEAKRVRRYLPGHSGVDTMILPTLFERTNYGLHSSIIDPNGWLTSARYDGIGRLTKLSYPYDFHSESNVVEAKPSIVPVRQSGYTVLERSQEQRHHSGSECTGDWEYRTFTEKIYDDEHIHAKVLHSMEGGGGGEPAMKGAEVLSTSCDWHAVGNPEIWHDSVYYGVIPFTLGSPDIVSLDSAIFEIIPNIIEPCFTMTITGEQEHFEYISSQWTIVTDTVHFTQDVMFNCDSVFSDTTLGSMPDTGTVSLEYRKIKIKLSPVALSLIEAGNFHLTVFIRATTSFIDGSFQNWGDDVMPQIKLYGIFKKDIDLTDYTLKYTYGDYYGSPETGMYAKIDDTLHTSSTMASDVSAVDNRRVSLGVSVVAPDGGIGKSTMFRGDPDHNVKDSVTFTNNGSGKPIEVADQLGYISRMFYDESGRVVKVNNPDSIHTTGDTNSKVTTVYDLGKQQKFGIVPQDQDFYGFCSKKSVHNEKGTVFTQYSDALGRMRREVADSEATVGIIITRYEYDILNRLTKVTNPQGQITQYWYDDFGRVKYKKQPDLGILSYSYDAMGNTRFTQTNEQDSLGKLTFHEYDDLNRVTVIGEAKLGYIEHDTLPNLNRWTDYLNPNILHDYDNSDILTANKTLWDTCLIAVPYVSANPTSSVCIPVEPYDQHGSDTSDADFGYTYTGVTFKQMLGTVGADTLLPSLYTNFEDIATHPQNVRIVIHYDTVPQRKGAVWGHYTPVGLASVWDSLCPTYKVRNMKGHEVAVAYREKANEPFHYVTMSYDERGRVEALLRFTGNIGFDAVYYTYNSANQVIKITTADGMKTHTTWYGYDWNGRIDSVWTKLGTTGLGLTSPKYPAQLTKPADTAVSIVYRYDKRGLIDSTLLPQARVVEKYSYNARKWLDSMTAMKGSDQLFKQKLRFDYVGNIISQKSKHLGQDSVNLQYNYDALNRLKLWSETDWVYGDNYSYDSVGNRKTQGIYTGADEPAYTNTYEYGNGNNQLTKVTYPTIATATTYKYTGDGALRVRQKREDLGHSYSVVDRDVFGYGYNGLLKTYGFSHWEGAYIGCRMDTNSAPQWQWQYRYSAGGERESKRMTTGIMDGLGWDKPHSWTYYLLGGNKQQLAVYNGRETTFPNACLDSGHRVHFYPTEYLTYGNGDAALISTRPNAKAEYKIVDHLGTTRVVLNDTGKVISTDDFEPFGKPLAQTGENPRKSFIDKEKDRESGTSDYGVRHYCDKGGRFISVDPMWEKYRNMSTYQYAGNNPVRALDRGGDTIIVLQDWEGTSVNAGHQAVLIGGDDAGWQLYSKNGGAFGLVGASTDPQAGEKENTFATLADFKKNAENDPRQGRFDNAIIIPTTVGQDVAARYEATKEVKSAYIICGASCTDVASAALKGAGKNPGTQTRIDGRTGDKYSAPPSPIPNERFKDIQKNNNAKSADSRVISNKRKDPVRNAKKENPK